MVIPMHRGCKNSESWIGLHGGIPVWRGGGGLGLPTREIHQYFFPLGKPSKPQGTPLWPQGTLWKVSRAGKGFVGKVFWFSGTSEEKYWHSSLKQNVQPRVETAVFISWPVTSIKTEVNSFPNFYFRMTTRDGGLQSQIPRPSGTPPLPTGPAGRGWGNAPQNRAFWEAKCGFSTYLFFDFFLIFRLFFGLLQKYDFFRAIKKKSKIIKFLIFYCKSDCI